MTNYYAIFLKQVTDLLIRGVVGIIHFTVHIKNWLYIFPELIFRNHISHENEAIVRKSISNERK